MDKGNVILKRQAEAFQLGVYCDIIKDLLIRYRSMSIIKIIVFSFWIKKQKSLQVECFSAHNSTDLVFKALSQLAGRYDELICQLPYIFEALDILIKNQICDIHVSEVMCLIPTRPAKLENSFIYLAIEESKSFTDRQFLREVISIV